MTRRAKIALLLLMATVVLMGYYALRLKRRAEQLPVRAADTRPMAPPVTGATEPIVLYVTNDNDGLLHKQEATIPLPADSAQRAQEVLRALISAYLEKGSHHPLASGADVNTVFLVKPNIAVIDVNAEFADGHRSGILVEELTLASLAQTVAANVPSVGRIKVLVDGKERETLAGHANLSSLYDVGGELWPVAQ